MVIKEGGNLGGTMENKRDKTIILMEVTVVNGKQDGQKAIHGHVVKAKIKKIFRVLKIQFIIGLVVVEATQKITINVKRIHWE